MCFSTFYVSYIRRIYMRFSTFYVSYIRRISVFFYVLCILHQKNFYVFFYVLCILHQKNFYTFFYVLCILHQKNFYAFFYVLYIVLFCLQLDAFYEEETFRGKAASYRVNNTQFDNYCEEFSCQSRCFETCLSFILFCTIIYWPCST